MNPKHQSYTCASLVELNSIAGQILRSFEDQRIFTLSGQMGSGKTTLIKAFCSELNVDDTTSSPTFSLVNEYHASHDMLIYHFDLYRLEKDEDLLGIGFEEYIDSGFYCFIEWPDLAFGLLPLPYVAIEISADELNQDRVIACRVVE